MSETEVDKTAEDQRDEVIRRYSAQVRIMSVQNKALSNLIVRQRDQLRTLNNVIMRRKWATRKLREYTDAVKALHRPVDGTDLEHTKCRECAQPWPCRTSNAVTAVVLDCLPEGLRQLLSGGDHVHNE